MGEGLAAGEVVGGRYRIIRRLGLGGMGAVYLANHQGVSGFERLVALKVAHDHISSDAGVMEMFLAEARLSAQLQHANLGQVYDLGKSEDLYFIAMEYIPGIDLRALINASLAQQQRLPIPLVVFIVCRVLEALDYAHDFKDKSGQPLQLVHRDVTPVNCLIGYTGDVKLIDFGIAKAVNRAATTKTGFVRGKLHYMSPEQARGSAVDRRTDVFAVGVMLYELLMGFRPFDAPGDLEMLGNLMAGRYPAPRSLDPGIPLELERVVKKALVVDREQRYATAGAMDDDLEQWLLSTRMRVGPRELAGYLTKLRPPGEAEAPAEVTGSDPAAVTPHAEPIVELQQRDTLSGLPPVEQDARRAPTRLKPMVPPASASASEASDPVTIAAVPVQPEPPEVSSETRPSGGITAPVRISRQSRAISLAVFASLVAGALAVVGIRELVDARRAEQGAAAVVAEPPAPLTVPAPLTPPAVVEPSAPKQVEVAFIEPPAPKTEPPAKMEAPVTDVPPAPKTVRKKAAPAPLVAPLSAYLSVKATQPSEVFVDGSSLGATPLKATLKPGKHELRVDCGGQRGTPAPVQLPPEQETEVAFECPR